MANYDNKLGEWFKNLDKQEKELKAKKNVPTPLLREEPEPVVEEAPPFSSLEVQETAREASVSVVTKVDTASIVADTTLVDAPVPPADNLKPVISQGDTADKLFSDEDIPQVEDFFSFLNRTAEQEPPVEIPEPPFEDPKEQGSLNLSEGTGEPRPIIHTPKHNPSAVDKQPVKPEPVQNDQPAAVSPVSLEPISPTPAETTDVVDADVQEKWDRVPHHLQTLFGSTASEIAQNSYKAFKETREMLIQRLLDPTISLEEAARILNVCPTTVRRYTNRGVLKHHRTVGNQRRFKLSDVLVFMENGPRRGKAKDEE